jgi:hypothetical protein
MVGHWPQPNRRLDRSKEGLMLALNVFLKIQLSRYQGESIKKKTIFDTY